MMMTEHSHDHRGVLNAIAAWVKRYREAQGLRNEMANCTPEQVATIARDMGITSGELLWVTAKGRQAANELPRLLRALGVDPDKLASEDPLTMRDLQRICISCGHKGECRHDLAQGTAATHYREYCPNAISLDALFTNHQN
jgi:transcriptional regulator with XRE-family HTH domain